MTPVYIRNASGHYASPSSTNVAVALRHATLNRDLTQNLMGVYNAPEANAYPLASYSYLITQTTGFDPAKGAVLGKWIIYIACAGQKEAAPLGYSPLSPNLVKDVFAAVRRIPGAPTPPPLTASACPNPTITGQGYGGSPGDSHPTSGPPAGGTTPTIQSGNGGGKHTGKMAKTPKSGGQALDPATAAALGQTSALTVTPLTAGQRRAAYVAALSAAKQLAGESAPSALLTAAVLAVILLGPLALAARRNPSTDGGADV